MMLLFDNLIYVLHLTYVIFGFPFNISLEDALITAILDGNLLYLY
jgi:hypothetical protein